MISLNFKRIHIKHFSAQYFFLKIAFDYYTVVMFRNLNTKRIFHRLGLFIFAQQNNVENDRAFSTCIDPILNKTQYYNINIVTI